MSTSGLIISITDLAGAHVAIMTANQRGASNPFSSGATGFNANGKVTIDNVIHQVSINFVAVRSKAEKDLASGVLAAKLAKESASQNSPAPAPSAKSLFLPSGESLLPTAAKESELKRAPADSSRAAKRARK